MSEYWHLLVARRSVETMAGYKKPNNPLTSIVEGCLPWVSDNNIGFVP